MERDFAVRFTDETYASKDEVKRSLNISSIDSIWEKISFYRSYFKRSLELSSIEHKVYHLCFTIPLQQRVINLEKRMTKLMVEISKMDEVALNNFIDESLLNLGKSYAAGDSLNIEQDTLKSLIEDSTIEVPQAYLTLKNYLLTLKYYVKRSANIYDLGVLTSFYGRILRKEINPLDFDSFMRMIDLNNPADHVMFNRHYNGAPLDKIEALTNELMRFNKVSIFGLIKAVISYFYLIYIKPFDYFNEECGLLSLKYIIAQDNIPIVPFLLNFEKRLLNINSDEFKNKFIISELSLDLTYFTNYILDIIDESLKEFEEELTNREIKTIKDEFRQAEVTSYPKPVEQHIDLFYTPKNNPVVFEQKVSMPTLPTGLDAKDIDLIADNLLELYPSLKVNQAKFYASHCTIGKYYSIAQYKKETGVAYETARTSMDNLVNLGFYKKEQIKNKYVYTPVVR